MAEVIAGLVLRKLADAALNKIVSLCGAGDKLDSIQRELDWTRAFLTDAESKRNSNETVKTWVNNVREVAYRIEDVIDTFMVEFSRWNRTGKVNALKRNLKLLRKLPTVHKLTCEMDKIQRTLIEIKELTERYGINRDLGGASSVVPMRRPVIHPDEENPDIVGLHNDRENIVKLLLDPNTKRRCVVSIVGQGGLGKTTLARKAYNSDEVQKGFAFRSWLSVSQQFELIDLLKTVLEKIRPLTEYEKTLVTQGRAIEHFSTQLNESLKQKRYLIVLDDVWTDALWVQIKAALPDVGNNSRVLLTTRSAYVVRKADPTCEPYKLRYLSKEEGKHLLLKKAFPYQNPEPYLQDISDLPNKLAERCGGLPLALVVVGGILCREPPTYNSWHKVLKKFSWLSDEGRECTEILATSYEILPFLLKPCFMYFSSFPEDHKIRAKSLIRMWVAEGFIPEEERKTMEETAEDFLEELVQRSMIQVSQTYLNGSIKYCHIHDLLLELAIKKGREDRFLNVISNQDGNCSSSTVTRNVRHAALHCDLRDIRETTGPNLRSLINFGDSIPASQVFRYLKVLYAPKSSVDGDTFQKLAQLRYIKMWELWGSSFCSHCGLNFFVERQFLKGMRLMRNLQTIHISDLRISAHLLDCIWKITTLRHVILPHYCYGPPSKADLPNLQTLKGVKVRKEWMAKGGPIMPNIRVLKITCDGISRNYEESLCTFLSGFHHLTSLKVTNGYRLYDVTRDMIVFPWYDHLQSLFLEGSWMSAQELGPIVATTSSFPMHLTKLELRYSKIEENPMPILGKLGSLKRLTLGWYAYVGRQLYCSTEGFPCLQFLTFEYLYELEEWKADVEEGAMPMLKEIKLYECPQLRLIPGLCYMASLREFTSIYGSIDLHRSLREDESHKIRDGQFVQMDIQDMKY